MLLSAEDGELFLKLHRGLLHFVSRQTGVVPGNKGPKQLSVQEWSTLRDALWEQPESLEEYITLNPDGLPPDELDIVSHWRHRVVGKFFVFRFLTKHTLFLGGGDPLQVYGVVALTTPLVVLIQQPLPVMVKTVLLPFKGQIVYDGLLNIQGVSFGRGVKASLNDSYRQAKKESRVITTLPPENAAAARGRASQKPQKKTPPKKRASSTSEAQEAVQTILALIEPFCQERLTSQYFDLCRRLTEKLGRKRPSPLLRGRPNTWACGIVRTIGWVNYLDDSTTQPHMKMSEIDEAFGVSSSTGQQKSKQIRDLLKIRASDHHWMLPEQIEDSSVVWLLELNGMMVDIRQCPRHLQEVAYRKGLIPYIPDDKR